MDPLCRLKRLYASHQSSCSTNSSNLHTYLGFSLVQIHCCIPSKSLSVACSQFHSPLARGGKTPVDGKAARMSRGMLLLRAHMHTHHKQHAYTGSGGNTHACMHAPTRTHTHITSSMRIQGVEVQEVTALHTKCYI